jgi:hypothetical protein
MATFTRAFQPNLSGIVPGHATVKAPHHLLSMKGMGATADAAMKEMSRAEDKRQAEKFATPQQGTTPAMPPADDDKQQDDGTLSVPLVDDATFDGSALPLVDTMIGPVTGLGDATFDGSALPITTGPVKHKKPLLVFPTKEEVDEDPPAVSNTKVSLVITR